MKLEHKNNDEIIKAWHQASLWLAIIAGSLSFIIFILLLLNYFQGKNSDPLNSKELSSLKVQLIRQPQALEKLEGAFAPRKDDILKEQIRTLDLRLRKEHFQRREFSRIGGYMLLCCVSIFLVSARLVFDYRKSLPMPQPVSKRRDEESRTFRLARRSVIVFGLSVGIFASVFIVLNARYSMLDTGYSILDTDSILDARQPITDAGLTTSSIQHPASSIQDQASSIQQPASSTYPSQDEIKKNWPRFRGPGGAGVSSYTNIPISWNGKTGAGVLWKTAIPLPGKNSPIVWGDRIFMTGATEAKREVYCFDANSGKILWQRATNIPSASPEPPEVAEDTGYAAPTATTDGQRVYAIFANGDLVCFDFDGKQIWGINLGPFNNIYGYASSLDMYQNLLLVLLDQGGAEDGLSEIMAIDAASGKPVWNTERPVPNSWSTPIVINTGQRDEIIANGNPYVIAYKPTTGKELWRVKCLSGDIAPSPVYADGLVFAVNAYAVLAAIRPGGQGDVTSSNIVWTARDGLPDICSPLSSGELVFLTEAYGYMTCYDAKNGDKVWEHDMALTFKASPSLVGDNIYLMSEEGVIVIIKAAREFKEIGRCDLGEKVNACPAFMDGCIYIRGEENLYCIVNAQV